MKLLHLVVSAFLPLAILGTPLVAIRDVASEASTESIIAIRDAEARSVGLVKRNTEYCNIVNVGTTVGCWALPKHGGFGNSLIQEIAGKTKNIEFTCYTDCEDVNGNTSWDWAVNRECYVPGAYTDNTCSRANLGKCPWYDSDRAEGGCS